MAYIVGNKLRVTLDSQNLFIETSAIDGNIGEVEFTNTESPRDALGRLQYEGGTDVFKRTMNYTVFLDSTNLHDWHEGVAVAVSWGVTGGHSESGQFMPLTKNQSAGVKGAYKMTGSGFLTGNITEA